MNRVALLLSILSLAAAPAQAQWSTDALTAPRGFAGGAAVGNYALFAGGGLPVGQSDRVDIYDDVSGTWSIATLSEKRRYVAATVVGQYALFAGGWKQGGGDSDVVDVFDSQTLTWSTATLSLPRKLMGVTTVGTKAIFAGGALGFLFGTPTRSDRVDIYDSSLGAPSNPAAWSIATLSLPRFYMAATTAGNKAIFAGGTDYATAVYDRVDIYDDSTGTWSISSLSVPRAQLGAASVGTKAYFAGGNDSPTTLSGVVDVFDAQACTWSTAAPLSQPRTELSGASLGSQVLFAGGIFDPLVGTTSNVVDILNTGTDQWSTALLSQARFALATATIGGKVMFAGGISALSAAGPSTVIDIYEPVGVSYCEATVNSTGIAATISTSSGSASIGANDLVLSVTGVPNSSFHFFHGSAQIQIPFANGSRCVGGGVVRTPIGLATGGVAQMAIDLPSALITTPGVRNFQCWFRDPSAGGAGTNTSDAIAINFLP